MLNTVVSVLNSRSGIRMTSVNPVQLCSIGTACYACVKREHCGGEVGGAYGNKEGHSHYELTVLMYP